MRKKLPIVTFILLALNLLGLIWTYVEGENAVMYQYGMFQGALQRGQYLRAIVSAFLHFGFYHFASNMICLVTYGFILEKQIGSVRFALIYAAGILGSALLITFAGGRGLHAGASGAIWSLMTATLVYCLRNGQNPAYAFRGVILNLIYSFSAGVSWQGHIGGGIAGAIAALLLCRSRQDYIGPWENKEENPGE